MSLLATKNGQNLTVKYDRQGANGLRPLTYFEGPVGEAKYKKLPKNLMSKCLGTLCHPLSL
jgi:hypothetical protein